VLHSRIDPSANTQTGGYLLMKDTFRNIVSYEKLRRLRTKTKGTSLLILTAVGAVLFATLTFFLHGAI